MKNSVEETMSQFCPFGYLDIRAACKIGDEVSLREEEIFEIIDNFREELWLDGYGNIDPVYCVLEHVLQQARNIIDEETGYDFINDYSGAGNEIYTYGNFLASSYDYSEEAVDQLRLEIENVSQDVQAILLEDDMCKYFLSEVGIELSPDDTGNS